MTRAECIGLRTHTCSDGRPTLVGMAHREFVVPAGARVRLVRQRPQDDQHGPAFALVIAPPDPRGVAKAALAAACLDNAHTRHDSRAAAGEEAPW